MSLNRLKKLLDEIQKVLDSDEYPSEEVLMNLASRHEDIVNEAQKRLRSVDDLVSKGMQAEAAELADRDPALRAVVQLLDFSRFDEWNELLSRFEMAPIPAMPENVAVDLEDAFETSASCERLLNRYRTASLARAPLRVRLNMLRRLAQTDPSNPYWVADIKLFEQHRIAEIRNSLEFIVNDEDLSELTAVHREINSTEWRIAVPAEIRRRVNDTLADVRELRAHSELEKIAYELSDAFAKFDRGQATHLQQKFEAITLVSPLTAGDPLLDIAGPALDWLRNEQLKADREKDRRQRLEAIESQLADRTTLQALDDCCRSFEEAGFRIPDPVKSRIAATRTRLQKNAARRRQTLIGATVFVFVLGIMVTAVIARSISTKKSVARHAEQLRGLLSDAGKTGTLTPVAEYLDLLEQESSAISKSESLLELRDEFLELTKAEDERIHSIQAMLEDVRSLSGKATKLADFDDLTRRILQAESLAKNTIDRTSISEARTEMEKHRDVIQAADDKLFKERLEQFGSQAATLSGEQLSQHDQVISGISDLLKNTYISSSLRAEAIKIQAGVSQQKADVLQRNEIEMGLQRILDAVGKVPDYATQLQGYANKFPDTSRSQDFLKVAELEQNLWTRALAWNEIRSRVLAVDIATISVEDAGTLIDDIAAFQVSPGQYPGETKLEDRTEALRFVAQRRLGADGTMAEQIKLVFDGKAVTSSYLIETPDGKERYYANAAPDTEKSVSFEYFTTPNGDQTVPRQLSLTLFVDARERKREDWLSPPSRMTRSILELLDKSEQRDFESMITAATETVVNSKQVDPILRLLLTEKLIRLGADGSFFLGKRVAPFLKAFAESGVPRLTNWVDYEDKEVRRTRDVAEDFLNRFASRLLTELRAAQSDRNDWNGQKLGPAAKWIGWVYRNNRSEWVIVCPRSQSGVQSGSVCVFQHDSETAESTMVEVGKSTGGGSVIVADSIASTSPLEGRPVFLLCDEP